MFFETVVLDLLHRMVTERAGHGGIDDIISLDKLGLEKVYVEANRRRQTAG